MVLLILVGTLGSGLWILRQSIKEQRSAEARIKGMAAVESGDWEVALAELSRSLSGNQDDVEALMVFANVRSRVPLPNDEHLSQALKLYLRAVELCLSQGAPKEEYIAALSGRARMELALSQLSRLTDTSLELLALDPEDTVALMNLQAIKQSTGDYLPVKLEDLIRGGRTTVQWLQALRESGDVSALRWVLERLASEEESLDALIGLIDVLRKGESVERQFLAGIEPEQLVSILSAIAEETPSLRSTVQIFQAEQALRNRDVLRTREILDSIEWAKIIDARLLLFAVNIREAMGTPIDLKEAERLLESVGKFALEDSSLIIQVVIRYWNSGRVDEAFALLENAIESTPGDPELIVAGAMLSTISGSEESETWVQDLDQLANNTSLSLAERERVDLARMILDKSASELLLASPGSLNRWLNETLVLCAMGDLSVESERLKAAVTSYQLALASTDAGSHPINARLLRALWKMKAITEAFRAADEYVENSQSVRSVIFLCDAWIRLKSVGLEPSDAVSGFEKGQSVEELLLRVESTLKERGADTFSLQPLLVRDAIVSQEDELAQERLETYLSTVDSSAEALTLLQIAESGRMSIPPELADSLRSLEAAEGLEDQLMVLEAIRYEVEGDSRASLDLLRSQFEGRDDYPSRRILGFAFLRLGIEDSEFTRQGFDLLLQDDVSPFDLVPILKIALNLEDREVAEKIIRMMVANFGAGAAQTTLAQALFSARFEIDNAKLVRRSIGEVDAALSRDGSNWELAQVLARLHLAEVNPNPTLAIDVLTESVRRSPESLQNIAFLVDQLQRLGRFEIADPYLKSLQKRDGRLDQQQRVFLASLLRRQGDLSEMRKSICDLAEETGNTRDLLACVQLHFNLGDFEAGDRVLNELALRPDRTSSVEIMLADREIERGDPERGIALIRNSTLFSDEIDRQIELATRLMRLKRWTEVPLELSPDDPRVRDSGKAQLLLAMYFLQGNQRDLVACRTALDRVLALNPEDANYVLQVVTIALGDQELRTEVDRYIQKLAMVDAERAEIISLRLEFDERMASMASLDGLEERASDLLGLRPDLYVIWNLFLSIGVTEFELARERGDLLEMQRLESALQEASSRMIQRFRNSSRALGRASRVQLLLNNPDEAILLARDGIQKVTGTPVLGDVLPAASAEFYRREFGVVITLLSPFSDEIRESPMARRESWRILFQSLLQENRVEEALEIYDAMFLDDQTLQRWRPWILALGALDPAISLAACRAVEARLFTFDLKLALAETMANVYRASGDRAVREEFLRIMGQISSSEDPYEAFRRAVLGVEFSSIDRESEALEQSLRVQSEIPADLLQKIISIDQLPIIEKPGVELAFSSLMIFYNNLIARVSEKMLEGTLELELEQRLVGVCQIADGVLEQFLPNNSDVLDSRATLALALGDKKRAMDLSLASLAITPGSPVCLLTMARIELAGKNFPRASEAAALARTLERAKPSPNLDLIRRAEKIIEASSLNGSTKISLGVGEAA